MPRPLQTLLLIVLACAPCTLLAATLNWEGMLDSGAYYRIAAPDDWRAGDAVVLYQHGFNSKPASKPPSLGPLEELMLEQGYAVAATSFRQAGWALFHAVDDNRDLLAMLQEKLGAPGNIIPFGGSMGGLIALKLAEQDGLPPVPGVLSLCPAAQGSRLWDAALDLRLAYDVVCTSSRSRLPEGAQPLPWAMDLDQIPTDLDYIGDQVDALRVLAPVVRCTGLGLPPELRTSSAAQRLAQLMDFAGTDDEEFFATNLAYATFALGDLVRQPDKLAGRSPVGNIGAHYPDPMFDAGIARVEADPMAALQLRWLSDFHGNSGDTRIISLHTSGDQLVIPGNQDVLRERVPADRLVSAIVVEDEPSHCGFNPAEGMAGWQALQGWMQGGTQPSVAELQQQCQELEDGGAEGPCRFDPQAQYEAFDAVVAPRPTGDVVPVDRRYSGQWFSPQRSGEGVHIEILDATRALVTFYTFPAQGLEGRQAWLSGVGLIEGDSIVVDPVTRPMRASDGDFSHQLWGRAYLRFDQCGEAHMRWEGPSAWGNLAEPLQQLTAISGLGCAADTDAVAEDGVSGSWLVRGIDGYGISLEAMTDERMTISWNMQRDGNQYWYGGMLARQGDVYRGELYDTRGTWFGSSFDADAVRREKVGDIELRLQCPHLAARLHIDGDDPAPFILERLTVPAGVQPRCAW